MDEDIKSGYVAGVVCSLAAVIFIIFSLNMGLNDMTGQIVGVFGLLFAILGTGSFWKPTLIGPIANQILENFARSSESDGSRQTQSQHNPKNSPQAITGKGDVNITQNIYQNSNKK